jgi:hypothetical protein
VRALASAAHVAPSREAERSERGGVEGGGPKGIKTLSGFSSHISPSGRPTVLAGGQDSRAAEIRSGAGLILGRLDRK